MKSVSRKAKDRSWYTPVLDRQRSESDNLRSKMATLEGERQKLKRRTAHLKKKIEELEETLKGNEQRYQNHVNQIKEKDDEIKRLREEQKKEEGVRYELEEKIDTLERKVRRMGNTDPNLDPSLAEEVERLRRKLNEEGQDHLKQVDLLEQNLRREQLNHRGLYRSDKKILTGLTQIWDFCQKKDEEILVAMEHKELRQKITQMNTEVNIKRKIEARGRLEDPRQKIDELTTENSRLRVEKRETENRNAELKKENTELSESKRHYDTLKARLQEIAVDVSMDQSSEDSSEDESASAIVINLHQLFKDFKRSLNKLTEEAEANAFTFEEEVTIESTTSTAQIIISKSMNELRSKLKVITQENLLLKWCLEEVNKVASSELRDRETKLGVVFDDDVLPSFEQEPLDQDPSKSESRETSLGLSDGQSDTNDNASPLFGQGFAEDVTSTVIEQSVVNSGTPTLTGNAIPEDVSLTQKQNQTAPVAVTPENS